MYVVNINLNGKNNALVEFANEIKFVGQVNRIMNAIRKLQNG
jgi:hypothetical protein